MIRWFNLAFLSYFPEFKHVDVGWPFKCNATTAWKFGILWSCSISGLELRQSRSIARPSQRSSWGQDRQSSCPSRAGYTGHTCACPRRDLYEKTMRYYCEISVKTKSKNLSSIRVSNLAYETIAMSQPSSTYSAAMCNSDMTLWASEEIITSGDQQEGQVWGVRHVGYGPDLGQRRRGWRSRLNLSSRQMLQSPLKTKMIVIDSPLIMFPLHFLKW